MLPDPTNFAATLSVLYRKHARIISPVLSTSGPLEYPGTAVPSGIFLGCVRARDSNSGLGLRI